MKDSEYLTQLFNEYLQSMESLNDITPSFYSKDEYKIRHKIFKQVFAEYRMYKFKLFIQRLKTKIMSFKIQRKERKIKKVINDYNKLKENGVFLPTIKE